MKDSNTFPLSLDFEGRHNTGEVTPFKEKRSNGMPVFFRVTIDGELFAYLCCGDNGWREKDDSGKPKDLVGAMGKYIFDFYE